MQETATLPTRDPDDPPFERIGIAGTGLIGGSIALAAKAAWPGVHVSGTASRGGAALPDGMVDRTVGGIEALAADCDLIVLGVPVPVMPHLMARIAAHGTRAVVTDAGSTKRGVMRAAEAAGLASFVGGHPMAGGERPGAGEARADLFVEKPWLLVRGSAGEAAADRLVRFVRALGGVPMWMAADAHDRAVAYVSHLPQILAAVLMNTADAAVGESGPHVAGRAFAEMTRLASSPPEMWRDICAENADFVGEALRAFLRGLPDAAGLDQAGAWAHDALTQSGDARRRWRGARRLDDQP